MIIHEEKYKGKERNTWIPIVEEARNYEKIEKINPWLGGAIHATNYSNCSSQEK